MNSRLTMPMLVLALAGCADVEERPTPIPDWRAGHGDFTVPPASPVNWSDGLSLDELLSAVGRHGRAVAALEEWQAARARRVTAGTYPLYPEVEFEGAQSFGGDRTMAGISIRQMIELGGRVSKREAVADAGIARAGADARDMLRELRGRARRAYWAAVVAGRKLDVARRSAEVAAKDLEVAVARYEARQASAIDMNLARVRSAQARAAVTTAEGEANAARAEVEAIVWEPAPAGWTPADSVPANRPEPDLAKALQAARAGRPDLAALLAAADEAGARAVLASAEAAPELGIGVGYEFGRDRIEGDGVDIRMSEHSATIGLSLSLPLWNRKRGDILEAEADRRRFAALHAALDSEVGREIASATAQLRAASGALDLYEKEILPTVTKNLDDVRAAYAAGAVGISDLLRAQQDYLDAQAESVELEGAYTQARADLETAVDRPFAEFAK
ncbi:MAG: TolC family protein [Planctomycetota bacterium]